MRGNPRTEPAPPSKECALPSTEPAAPSASGKQVVLCIGNRYLGDDGVGLSVAEALDGTLEGEVLVESSQAMDLPLLSRYEGASKVVVVDALKSGARPGEVSRYALAPSGTPLEALKGQHSLGLHDFFDVAWQTGLLNCPVTVIGVEPKNCDIGERLSDEVARAIPQVVAEVKEALAC